MVATIADVARRAKVSTATVSRVLAGLGHARPETRERILAAARDLDYRPSAIARSLQRRSTQTFGLIVTDIENPYFPELVRAVEDAARAEGYTILLCNAADDPERESGYLDLLVERRVDGADHRGQQPGCPPRRVARVAAAAGRPDQHDRARRRPAVHPVGQPGRQPARRRAPPGPRASAVRLPDAPAPERRRARAAGRCPRRPRRGAVWTPTRSRSRAARRSSVAARRPCSSSSTGRPTRPRSSPTTT